MLRRVLLCILLLSAVAGCAPRKSAEFGIYLLRGEMTTSSFMAADLARLDLQDDPVIASADIVTYNRTTHEMELTTAAYQRYRDLFTLPVDVDGLPFVVCVGSERIYRGAFWTPLSSLIFDGVVILDDLGSNAPRVQLYLGYPSPQAFGGSDPRADERIFKALEAAGKLDSGS